MLRHQSAETRALVRDTGEVFAALTERQGQLRDLIVNSNRVWETTARRDSELADTFRVLPDLPAREPHDHAAPDRVRQGHQPADRPAAPGGAPALADADLPRRAVARPARPVQGPRPARARVSHRPAGHRAGARQHAAAAAPRSTRSCASSPRSSTTSASTSARSRPSSPTTPRSRRRPTRVRAARGSIHYLRTQNPENPEVMAGYPSRLQTNRSNPYIAPGGYMKLKTEGHLETYGTQGCGDDREPRTAGPARPVAAGRRGQPDPTTTRSATTRTSTRRRPATRRRRWGRCSARAVSTRGCSRCP